MEVVPQITWASTGICAPGARWCAAWDDYHPRSVHLVDGDGRSLSRVLPLELPRDAAFSPDGQTVQLIGMFGNPGRHVPVMAHAVQTINLSTGELETSRGPMSRDTRPQSTDMSLPEHLQPPEGRALEQRSRAIFWDEASGTAVVTLSGQPEGGVVAAWDIRRGRFLRSLGQNNDVSKVSGFLGSGQLLANAWTSGAEHLSIIDVATGAVRPTKLPEVDRVLRSINENTR